MLLHNFGGKHDMEWVHFKAFFFKRNSSHISLFSSPEGYERLGGGAEHFAFSTFQTMKKNNLSEITYVTNTTVLQRHQSCSWAVLKSLENRSVCQGMNFIDICSVKFNSLKDAVQTLIWWNEQPRGTAAHSPRLLTACSGACLEASRGLQWSKLLGTSVSRGHSRGVRDDRRYSKHSSALVS